MNVITCTAAMLPLALLFLLLAVRRMPAIHAAALALATSWATAVLVFKAPLRLALDQTLKGGWNSLSIIAVIFAAIFTHQIGTCSAGFAAVQRHLSRLVPNQLLQILVLARCFASFLQGPSGFGVPVAVTAPLLAGIGVKPFWAIALTLLAHAWANTFGTLALAWQALVMQTDLAGEALRQAAWWSGVFTGIVCLVTGILVCWCYNGWKGVRLGWPALIVFTIVQAGGQLTLVNAAPTLAAVIPTAAALLTVPILARLPRYCVRDPDAASSPILVPGEPIYPSATGMSVHSALLPYYLLTGISLAALLIPSLNRALAEWTVAASFAERHTGYGYVTAGTGAYAPIAWLTHPSFFLALAGLLTGVYYYGTKRITVRDVKGCLSRTWRRALPVALSVALLLAMSMVMAGSGQIDLLADTVSRFAGRLYPALAPAIGMAGAFMSSSNVSSNILFTPFQQAMASFIDVDAAILLAGQTAGAAAGCMFAPSNVLLGAAAIGAVGLEGKIVSTLLGYGVLVAVVLGAAAMALA